MQRYIPTNAVIPAGHNCNLSFTQVQWSLPSQRDGRKREKGVGSELSSCTVGWVGRVHGSAWEVSQRNGEMLVCVLLMRWQGLIARVSRPRLNVFVMCYNPSSNLATDAVNPSSICCTKINFEAAVDVQVLCTAKSWSVPWDWCRYCMLLLLHILLGGVVQTL